MKNWELTFFLNSQLWEAFQFHAIEGIQKIVTNKLNRLTEEYFQQLH